MISIAVENLSKCYQLDKTRGFNSEGFAFLLQLLKREPRPKSARGVWALKDASFTVEQGEVLGVIGRNGAGKSTLLKILARIIMPTAGRAIVRGRVVSLLELGTGIDSSLSGRENIFLNAAFYGIKQSEAQRNFDDIVAFAELEKSIDSPVRSYSSGMYLRLAFSMAIHMKPDILLADEVLAVGDIGFQNRCIARMQEIGQSGVTILFVSHDMQAIQRMCDRCICLDQGMIVDEGTPREVVRRYEEKALMGFQDANPDPTEEGDGPQRETLVNDQGRILSVLLLAEGGQEIGAVKVSQDVWLQIRFELFTPNVKLLCFFDFETFGIEQLKQGLRVFRTVTPDYWEIGEPGCYEATVKVPQFLLAEIDYSVNAIIWFYDQETGEPISYLVWDKALAFRVYDNGEALSARGRWTGRMRGVVSPMLEWRFEKK